ncbi:MAG: glycosyltransferase family 2 protein, partial [Prevotellaceae bacterium]|nr:glycosyltransferase family 2 protein [Prevotellaceae bacterium]
GKRCEIIGNTKGKDPVKTRKMMSNLVSVITPVYNMERYLERYLDSVFMQTYLNIELILVDDGSTDGSKAIIDRYISIFHAKGIIVKYLYQQNAGLAAAINTGLQVFTGEYLIWPDSDDFMSKTLIEKMVLFLEEKKEYGLVRVNVNMLIEKNGSLKNQGTIIKTNNKKRFLEDLFDITMFERDGCWFCAGSYMVRTRTFIQVNSRRSIYPCPRGQNWQMLLPVMYISKCGFIDEALHNVVIYNDSMSHSDITMQDVLYRIDEHEDVLLNVIKTIPDISIEEYTKKIRNKYHIRRFRAAINFGDKRLLKKYFDTLRENNLENIKIAFCFFVAYYLLPVRITKLLRFAVRPMHNILGRLFR